MAGNAEVAAAGRRNGKVGGCGAHRAFSERAGMLAAQNGAVTLEADDPFGFMPGWGPFTEHITAPHPRPNPNQTERSKFNLLKHLKHGDSEDTE